MINMKENYLNRSFFLGDQNDKNLYNHQKSTPTFTNEYSIQVNMGSIQNEHVLMKRKKKKEYKKRKRQRNRQNQKKAKEDLIKIIQSIYRNEDNFEGKKKQIQICLSWLDRQEKFNEILNQTIRNHVREVQAEIWEHTEIIQQQAPFNKEDCLNFYQEMGIKIYQEYISICKASVEIQKIINFYSQINGDQDVQEFYSRDLDRNTFNYLIESDQTLKNLIYLCDKKVSSSHKFNKISQILRFCRRDHDQEEYYEQQTEQSTSIQDQEYMMQKKQEKRKIKRKRKIKDSQITPQIQDLINRLETFVVDENERLPCRVTDQWLESLQQYLKEKKKC